MLPVSKHLSATARLRQALARRPQQELMPRLSRADGLPQTPRGKMIQRPDVHPAIMQNSLGVDTAFLRLDLFPFATQPPSRTLPIMKSKRNVLLALTINKHYFIRGVVRYAREHDW